MGKSSRGLLEDYIALGKGAQKWNNCIQLFFCLLLKNTETKPVLALGK